MELLQKDIIKLLFVKYLSGHDAVKCLRVCKRFSECFTDQDKYILRQKCALFVERNKQNKYIDELLEHYTKGTDEKNAERIAWRKKPKKYNYYFCNGCANIIRAGVHRKSFHETTLCKRYFKNCEHCNLPFSFVHESTDHSIHAKTIGHNELMCPHKKITKKKTNKK